MEFVGFQHSFPVFLLSLIWLGSILLIWWSYSKEKKLDSKIGLGLSTLRTLSVSILFLLILNPIFFSSDLKNSPQKMMVLLDSSESMSINKGDYKGAATYKNVLDELQQLGQQLNIDWYQFGNFVRPSSDIDSIRLNDSDSRLTQAIQQVQALKEDFQGVLLVSDGIHNSTIDPSIEAELTGLPFYVVAMGDTNGVQDVSIVDVQRSSLGYLNTSHEFSVSIQADGYANEQLTLSMSDLMGNVLESTTLEVTTSGQRIVHPFRVNLKEIGLQSFRFSIEALESEWTLMNNELRTSVQVIDDQIDVVHIAYQVHPDVRMIRDIVSTNPQMRLHTVTLQRDGSYLETNLDEDLEADVVIIHGEPWVDILELTEKIGLELSSMPMVYLHIPSPVRSRLLNSSIWDPMNNWFDNSVGLFQLNANTNETSAPVNANSLTSSRHPIVADIPRLTESTPSLSGILSRPLSLYDTIINARYVGDQEVFPAIQVKQFSSSRTVLVSHWNWYLFYQSSRDQLRNYVDQMFSNVIYWVNSNPNEDNIQINTSRTTYSVNESVQFNATLLNDSGQPENDASVEILIYEHNSMDAVLSSDDVLETQISTNNAPKDTFEGTELRSNIQLTPSGSGEYTGTIDINEEGIFSYDAIVRKNGTEVTRNSGQFIVQKSNDEFVVTSRNNSLLQRIATETDGFFVEYDEIELLRDSMQTTGLFESVDILVEEYFYPVQKVVWFFIVLILLGLEWFARKWYGLL